MLFNNNNNKKRTHAVEVLVAWVPARVKLQGNRCENMNVRCLYLEARGKSTRAHCFKHGNLQLKCFFPCLFLQLHSHIPFKPSPLQHDPEDLIRALARRIHGIQILNDAGKLHVFVNESLPKCAHCHERLALGTSEHPVCVMTSVRVLGMCVC